MSSAFALEIERLTSNASDARYSVRLANCEADVRQAQALRFAVFNVELGEGLDDARATRLDADRFDAVCDHLIVISTATNRVVGTYRMQTGARAGLRLGYYSEREFDFAPFRSLRGRLLELGRACIDADHRNFTVLNLLWKGIATYAQQQDASLLIGCSSLTSQDQTIGAAAYGTLQGSLASAGLRTQPHPEFACDLTCVAPVAPKLPRLLSAYLTLGAKICAPPAIDREFKTIDFLTLFDVHRLRVGTFGASRYADNRRR